MGAMEEMITVLKSLEGKADQLIAALVNGGAATVTETKAARGRPPKDKAVETAAPSVTEEDVRKEFDRVKGLPNAQVPALKKVIADLGFSSLKDLCAVPDKFEAAIDALKAYEASLSGGDAGDDL